MKAAGQARALEDAAELDVIERALHGRLRAHRLSSEFIDRHGEDVLQQGIAEYERAVSRGKRIENPAGLIVETAYWRAIDELRRELREAPGEAIAGELGGAINGDPVSPTEEEAIANVSIEQLHAAIGKLSPQQRQALGLYYFEERSTREAAAVLGCGQTTFRRRLDSALRVLRERFGIVAPEPGEELAIEIGMAAWLSLSGARVVPNRGPLDQLIATADALRGAVGGLFDRSRDAAARLLASGGGEPISAVASAPLGRAGGVCAGALAACALTGVIGPGVGGVDLVGGGHRAHQTPHHAAQAPRPAPAVPRRPSSTAPSDRSPGGKASEQRRSRQASTSTAEARSRRATQAATSQFGVESAAPEGGGYSTPSEEPAPEASAPTSAEGASRQTPTEIANEQFAPSP